MKVSKITVSRLYNLGNYEHVRYELSSDVTEQESASQAFMNMVGILAAMKPVKFPRGEASEADYVRGLLAEPEKNFAQQDFCDQPVLDPETGKVKIDEEALERAKERLAEYEKAIAEYNAHITKREKAIAALDDLGGTTIQTDAKRNWNNDDEY
jgi:hypothetical protein